MEGHHHQQQYHHHQQQQQQQYVHQQHQMSGGAGITVGVDAGDRFPQWSIQETKEFLIIRAELDRNFMETKRNKLLWEVISTKMREKGFNRSAEQCKCKWKNLVTRYKGCETMEAEVMRQQFLSTTRCKEYSRQGCKGCYGPMRKVGRQAQARPRPIKEEQDGPNRVIRRGGRGRGHRWRERRWAQLEREAQWREEYEAREEERRKAEMEWRKRMEGLENERLMMERKWREKEEQRKIREEARAERRDALITTLLNKLRREDSN
ncbi:Trihelix transcription factor GT-3b [Bienertia sinuspersici]